MGLTYDDLIPEEKEDVQKGSEYARLSSSLILESPLALLSPPDLAAG